MGVAVVIPAHNAGKTIKRAIESALSADEVVIVNDASTDETDDVAFGMCRRHLNVWMIGTQAQFPAGPAYARNTAITHCHQELIVPLDADDEFLPGGLAMLKAAYEPGAFVYGGWWEVENGSLAIREVVPTPAEMLARKNVANATWLFSKTDWARVGGYPMDFTLGAEDYAFMCALVAAGVRPIRIEQAVYRYTKNSTGRAAKCAQRWPLIQQMIREHYPEVAHG